MNDDRWREAVGFRSSQIKSDGVARGITVLVAGPIGARKLSFPIGIKGIDVVRYMDSGCLQVLFSRLPIDGRFERDVPVEPVLVDSVLCASLF